MVSVCIFWVASGGRERACETRIGPGEGGRSGPPEAEQNPEGGRRPSEGFERRPPGAFRGRKGRERHEEATRRARTEHGHHYYPMRLD